MSKHSRDNSKSKSPSSRNLKSFPLGTIGPELSAIIPPEPEDEHGHENCIIPAICDEIGKIGNKPKDRKDDDSESEYEQVEIEVEEKVKGPKEVVE